MSRSHCVISPSHLQTRKVERGSDVQLIAAANNFLAIFHRDISLWHASYVQTYLERDVRTLRQIGDLSQFQAFLRALAARSAQLLNVTDLPGYVVHPGDIRLSLGSDVTALPFAEL